MNNLAKLIWQCRRGTQELDKLLLGYIECGYPQASLHEQQQFNQLLALPDDQLLHLFFLPHVLKSHKFAPLITKIQHFTTVSDNTIAPIILSSPSDT